MDDPYISIFGKLLINFQSWNVEFQWIFGDSPEFRLSFAFSFDLVGKVVKLLVCWIFDLKGDF